MKYLFIYLCLSVGAINIVLSMMLYVAELYLGARRVMMTGGFILILFGLSLPFWWSYL